MTAFSGFRRPTQEFLRDLASNNNRDWFETNRDRYQNDLLEPAKAFVDALAPHLRTFSPHIEAQPRINGSIFRMNRDVRFSKDKTPYKTNLDFWFWEGRRRTAATGYFLRITNVDVGIGAGSHGFDKGQLARYRDAVTDDPDTFLRAISDVEQSGNTLRGRSLKRLPRGLDNAHPDTHRYLLHKALYVGEDLAPPPSLHSSDFVMWCAAKWLPLAPLHEWLRDHVQEA
jgi:uncharacterized protein (TIGR02453 family)